MQYFYLVRLLLSKRKRNSLKKIGIGIGIICLIPFLFFAYIQTMKQHQEQAIQQAIQEVKQELRIENELPPALIFSLEIKHFQTTPPFSVELLKERIKTYYIKQITEQTEEQNSSNNQPTIKNVFKSQEEIFLMLLIDEKNKQELIFMIQMYQNSLGLIPQGEGFQIPAEHGQVTCSRFCYPGHLGTDIGALLGTPILASSAGTVIQVKTGCIDRNVSCGGGFGNHVVLVHNIQGTSYVTIYAHLQDVYVTQNTLLSSGFILGTMGNTGRSQGVHLHFEIIKDVNKMPNKLERLTKGLDTEKILQYPGSW